MVALRYLRGWFIVDVVSSIPIDYVALIFTEGEVNLSVLKASRALRAVRFVKLLSLLKLLRISHLLRFLRSWEDVCIINIIRYTAHTFFALGSIVKRTNLSS